MAKNPGVGESEEKQALSTTIKGEHTQRTLKMDAHGLVIQRVRKLKKQTRIIRIPKGGRHV